MVVTKIKRMYLIINIEALDDFSTFYLAIYHF